MSFLSKPRVDPPRAGALDDSIKTCGSIGKAYRYCHGQGKANYPVPAPIQYSEAFTVQYALCLCTLIFKGE